LADIAAGIEQTVAEIESMDYAWVDRGMILFYFFV
jgi:hypothetical protein